MRASDLRLLGGAPTGPPVPVAQAIETDTADTVSPVVATGRTVFVAPISRGSGDGSSAANAHRLFDTSDMTWLTNVLTAWRTELDANPGDRGLNEPHTIATVQPGYEPGYGDKSYVTRFAHGVWARRVCWLSDQGEYTVSGAPPGTGTWLTLAATALPAAPAEGVGNSPSNPIRRVHFVAVRSSDGLRADQVNGATTTRTKTVAGKDPAADWASGANYTTTPAEQKLWSGPTTTRTLSWSATLPSPIRAVLRGNRTPDPRTGDKTKQQWCVTAGATDQHLYDPNGTATEPKVLAGGNPVVITQGKVYDPDTGSITAHTWTSLGCHFFGIQGSCIGFQGFEVRDAQSLVTFGLTASYGQWLSFLDITMSNTRYGQWRGDNRYDVEAARWQCTSVSQKLFAPGQNCQRWNIRDIVWDGLLSVGDHFPSIIGAANDPSGLSNSFNAGPFRFERIIVERAWDTTNSDSVYVNGDGVDCESKGFAVRDFYCDLTPDGGIDTKASPYWVNWPATAVFNAWFGRNKRAYRSWSPAQLVGSVSPHILRDVTVADARQYGLFMVGRAGDHKWVDWHNPDGRANFANPTGRTYVAVSNDGDVGGDMDAVIHQLHDARTSGALTSGLNTNTVRGKTTAPYRARLWTPLTPPGSLTVAVDGVATDDGSAKAVSAGQQVVFAPSGQPAGTVYDYTLTGSGTVTRNGDNATVVVQ